MTALTSKEKASLRSAAQTLKPAVRIGREGVQGGAVAELHEAFRRSELIKVAFNAQRDEIPALCQAVELLTGSACVGGVGKRRSFFRAQQEDAEAQ